MYFWIITAESSCFVHFLLLVLKNIEWLLLNPVITAKLFHGMNLLEVFFSAELYNVAVQCSNIDWQFAECNFKFTWACCKVLFDFQQVLVFTFCV